NHNGKDVIICPNTTQLVAYDPADGGIIWSADGLKGAKGDVTYSSPIIADDLVVYLAGYGGPGMAIRLGGQGDITTSHRVWRQDSVLQSIGTGVYVDGYLYIPTASSGTMLCLDPRTGEEMWKARDKGGVHWGSITAVGKTLYVTAQSGSTLVFKATPDGFEEIAVNQLGEKSNSTPAVSNGEIFIRTHENLYCVSDNKQI
ncbi:MAG: outer membrane protein assembly factor BamB family protein, partial [Planctomycetota bacterium]